MLGEKDGSTGGLAGRLGPPERAAQRVVKVGRRIGQAANGGMVHMRRQGEQYRGIALGGDVELGGALRRQRQDGRGSAQGRKFLRRSAIHQFRRHGHHAAAKAVHGHGQAAPQIGDGAADGAKGRTHGSG